MITVLVSAVAIVWSAVAIAVGIALGKVIRLAQDDDRAPLDLRTALYVEDILAAAEVGK